MSRQRVSEAFDLANSRVDREKYVIHDVLLLGPKSLNGREYTQEARDQGVKHFEGKAVNTSHQKALNPATGKMEPVLSVDYDRRLGWVSQVVSKPEGIRGDLNLLRSNKFSETVFESAERNPGLYCFSPVFDVIGDDANPNKIIGIEKVHSVDLVTFGGTTKTLFEEAQLLEAPPEVQEELVLLNRQVLSEVASFRKDKDPAKASARILSHLQHHAKLYLGLTQDKGPEQPPEEPERTPEQKKEEEEVKQLKAEKNSRRVCEELEVPVTQDLLELLTSFPDEEARKKHVLYLKRRSLLTPSVSGGGTTTDPRPASSGSHPEDKDWEFLRRK